MKNKSIIVEIDKNGEVSIEGNNFIGVECDHFIKEISSALGTTKNFTKKKEYNMKTNIKQKERN